ncbi:hypothetical protein Tco_0815535 [Tanacetum coccineum]
MLTGMELHNVITTGLHPPHFKLFDRNYFIDQAFRKHDHKELGKKLVADKLGWENGVVVVNGFVEVRDDELIIENGYVVVVENENGHVGEITGEEVVKSIVQVVDANGIADVEQKRTMLNLSLLALWFTRLEKPSKDLQVKVVTDAVVTKDDLLTSPDPVENTDSQVIVNDDLESATSTLINEAECQVTIVEPSEEVQVKAHVSELAQSPVDKEQGQVTADESGKPFKDLESQVKANGSETCENLIKEDESEVSVDVSESIVCKSCKNHRS